MYGYVTPPPLSKEEMAIYNSFYCGLCICTGKEVGQKARFTTNHEITFFALLASELTDYEISFSTRRCFFSPRKIAVAQSTLFSRIVALNVILSYYKAVDGIVDGDGFKYKVVKKALKPAYSKCAKEFPEIDRIISEGYQKLRQMEQSGEKSIDRVSDCFASMMADCLREVTGSSSGRGVVYNVAKFIYLADALDDVDEDYRAKRYNVFLSNFAYDNDRQQFISENYDRLSFIFAATVNRAIQCLGEIKLSKCHDILCEITQNGLRQKTAQLLSSKKKLPPPKV